MGYYKPINHFDSGHAFCFLIGCRPVGCPLFLVHLNSHLRNLKNSVAVRRGEVEPLVEDRQLQHSEAAAVPSSSPPAEPDAKENWLKYSRHRAVLFSTLMVNSQASGVPPAPRSCAGCGGKIADRFLLFSMERYWHTHCLKCSCCQAQLGDIGTTCYSKGGLILCRSDYIK
ncbi:hypothetical protein XENOCAPTIV_017637 [Xenoophorus captivus]|uniref:LIM zinc-binding domain-containing protein n=1 Tax=Xenoophorus captivus TaxID=1517983 RepID=A0ABV0RTL6_9TELE